ncbi:hypothetical protein MBRA_06338 [Methylobacterium brachiatum]|nr:hypothetical protein MBRA_06338 [Methylobacterium brachiatum]
MGPILCAGMGLNERAVVIDAEYSSASVWTGLRGAGIERIDRNRGVAAVVRFAALSDDLHAWLGYQERWDVEGGRSPYTFREAGITIHVGDIGDPLKPQLLRLEWPGLRDWDRSGVGFQAPDAGHPHWQIDLFESLRQHAPAPQFEEGHEEEVEDFNAVTGTAPLAERIAGLAFERMHLASAAPWWSGRPAEFGEHHLNAPPVDQADLSRWVGSAVAYIRQELTRCGRKG